MAPPTGTAVELNGRTRYLRYTTRALVQLEERYGITMPKAGTGLRDGSLRTTALLLWAGLLHEDPGITPEQVQGMMELAELALYTEAVGNAINAAFGVTPEEAAAAAEAATEEAGGAGEEADPTEQGQGPQEALRAS